MFPLLFVIVMEYLSRMLKCASLDPAFKFHPRCAPLKLTHLSFADDLMLFSKGNVNSISILYEGLDHFAQSSGVYANSSKYAIYFLLAFLMGSSLLFWIMLASLKGSFHFDILVCLLIPEISLLLILKNWWIKMTSKIKGWQGKSLSYAARLQLINSVLMRITTYWCQIFILLKKFIKAVNMVCRAFLWHYDSNDPKLGNVKLESSSKNPSS